MKTFLSALTGALIVALWLWGKYHQAKTYAKDLGNGGIQKLFDEKPE
jgi:hypothetical protein